MIPRRALVVLLTAWAVAWPGSARAANEQDAALLVSAAVSLKEPLASAIAELETAGAWRAGPEIHLQLGGSSILAHQVLRGAPVDVFLSASTEDVERLVRAGRITRTCTLGENDLVVVVPAGQPRLDALEQLLEPRFARIAVANPRTSPLGRYTRQALEAARLEAGVRQRRIVAEHARQVVDYVARGEVDAGVIYASDAHRFAQRISIAHGIESTLHAPIVYRAALLERDPPQPWAPRLFDHLCSDADRAPWPGRR